MRRYLMVAVFALLGLSACAGNNSETVVEAAPTGAEAPEPKATACEPSSKAVCLGDSTKVEVGKQLDDSNLSCGTDLGEGICAYPKSPDAETTAYVYVDGSGVVQGFQVIDSDSPARLKNVRFGMTPKELEKALEGEVPTEFNEDPAYRTNANEVASFYFYNRCEKPDGLYIVMVGTDEGVKGVGKFIYNPCT